MSAKLLEDNQYTTAMIATYAFQGMITIAHGLENA